MEVSMNKMALWINFRVDDWTAELAIIASNISKWQISISNLFLNLCDAKMPILATFCITRKLEQVIESHTMAIHDLVSSLAVVKIGYIMNIFYSLLRLAEQQGFFMDSNSIFAPKALLLHILKMKTFLSIIQVPMNDKHTLADPEIPLPAYKY